MAWCRPKNVLQRRLQDLEAERQSTAAEIDKIRTWVGDAREGHVELAPAPRKARPMLGVEKRRARARFVIWMIVLLIVLVAAWRFFLAR
ncbi:MAG TPA: hypothetical protein PLU30_25325 [Verrucomicrobiae bacterium]|nr:hypothetical protein [Verrucomicrobiae bacterium]